MSPSQQQLFNDLEEATSEVMNQDLVRPFMRHTSASCSSAGSAAGVGGSVITSSIDEGVELDFSEHELELCGDVTSVTGGGMTSQTSMQLSQLYSDAFSQPFIDDVSSHTAPQLPTPPPPPAGSHQQFTSEWYHRHSPASNTSSQSLNTSMSSPFTSFDSNIEADLLSSRSSGLQSSTLPVNYSHYSTQNASQHGQSVYSNVTATMTPPVRSKFAHRPRGGAGCLDGGSGDEAGDASGGESPLSFRQGRRASDGFMCQHVCAFRQRLRESMKTRGVAEIHKEMATLATRFKTCVPEQELRSLQQQHRVYQEETSLRQRSLEENPAAAAGATPEARSLSAKRMSLPSPAYLDSLQLRSLKQLADKQLLQKDDAAAGASAGHAQSHKPPQSSSYSLKSCEFPSQKSLQQQLLHHRLQQKRQLFQRHGHTLSGPPASNQHFLRQFQQMHIEQAAPPSAPSFAASVAHPYSKASAAPGFVARAAAAAHDCSEQQRQMSGLQQQLATHDVSGVTQQQHGKLPHQSTVSYSLEQQLGTNFMQNVSGGGAGDASLIGDVTQTMSPDLQAALAQQQQQQQPTPPPPPHHHPAHPSHHPPHPSHHLVRQSSYKLAQQQPILPPFADDDRLMWHQATPGQPPPLSPMFEETGEDDATMDVDRPSSSSSSSTFKFVQQPSES